MFIEYKHEKNTLGI